MADKSNESFRFIRFNVPISIWRWDEQHIFVPFLLFVCYVFHCMCLFCLILNAYLLINYGYYTCSFFSSSCSSFCISIACIESCVGNETIEETTEWGSKVNMKNLLCVLLWAVAMLLREININSREVRKKSSTHNHTIVRWIWTQEKE